MDGYNEFLVNTSNKGTLAEQPQFKPMPSEKAETQFGYQSLGSMSIGILRANQIIAGILQGPNGGTFFDLDNDKIQMSDASNPRVILQGDPPKFVISKAGIDANLATAAQSLIYIDGSSTTLFFAYVFNSPAVATTDAFTGSLGAVIYDTSSDKNAAPSVTFYKESNWTITSATFRVRFFAGFKDTGSAWVDSFPRDVRVRLNATRTLTGRSYPLSPGYYRYNSGTVLTMDGEGSSNFTPTSDGQAYTDTLSGSEIANFTNGWNEIIIQADTDDNDDYGYCTASILITGYQTIT